MEEGFWHEAERVWTHLSETHAKNRVVKFKRAVCLSEIGEDWPAAKLLLEEVTKGGLTKRFDPFNPNQMIPPVDALLWLANAEHRMGEFELVREHVEAFFVKAGEKHGSTEWASKILAEIRFAENQMQNPTSAVVIPMSVNSQNNETHPSLTADGKTLFFSSNRPRSNGTNHGRMDPNTREHYYDVYQSSLQKDSTWGEPTYLNLGIRHHARVIGSDAFGQELIVVDDDGWTPELKTTSRWERGWTVAEPFYLDRTIPLEGEIVFFPGKQHLIASVKTRRGEGGYDLFESSIDEAGRWSKLKSLGQQVNSWGDEMSPFVAADGQTLFYASNGLECMGGFDVFRTTKDANGDWTDPENLGAPINSVDDELAFVVGAKGEMGYLASRRNGNRGDLQLFEVIMRGVPALEKEVVILTLDAENLQNDEKPAALLVTDAATGKLVQHVKREDTQDAFNLILPAGGEFIVETGHPNLEINQPAQTPQQTQTIRKTLVLSEDLGPAVIEMAVEDVFPSILPESMVNSEKMNEGPFVIDKKMAAGNFADATVQVSTPSNLDSRVPMAEEGERFEGDMSENADSGSVRAGVDVNPNLGGQSQSEGEERPKADDRTQSIDLSALDETVLQWSAPVTPLALAEANAGELVMAVQLYRGQVHTQRMNLTPTVEYIVAQSTTGRPVVRIEGSASDVPTTRDGGNEALASSRAMDVYIRLTSGLSERGFEKGRDYDVTVVRRVQPDEKTPGSCVTDDAHPASFQYIRVDVAVR